MHHVNTNNLMQHDNYNTIMHHNNHNNLMHTNTNKIIMHHVYKTILLHHHYNKPIIHHVNKNTMQHTNTKKIIMHHVCNNTLMHHKIYTRTCVSQVTNTIKVLLLYRVGTINKINEWIHTAFKLLGDIYTIQLRNCGLVKNTNTTIHQPFTLCICTDWLIKHSQSYS